MQRARGVVAELGLFVAKFCVVLVVIGGVGSVLAARGTSEIAAALDQVKAPKQVSDGRRMAQSAGPMTQQSW